MPKPEGQFLPFSLLRLLFPKQLPTFALFASPSAVFSRPNASNLWGEDQFLLCVDVGGKMVESGNNLNPSKKESLSNGHVARGPCSPSGEARLEQNGSVAAPMDQPVKLKRRSVSAVRDFPPGCGRFAPNIDARQKETVGIDSAGGSSGAGESESLSLSEHKSNELPKSSDGVSLPNSSNVVLPEALEVSKSSAGCCAGVGSSESLLKRSDGVVLPNSSNFVVPEALEVDKVPDKMRAVDGWENLKSERSEPIMNSNHMEMMKPLKSLSLVESTSCQLGSMEMPGISGQVESFQPRKSSGGTGPGDSLKVLTEIPFSNAVVKAFEECPCKKYPPPRRKISADRDFPPGCGRNAPPIAKEVEGKGFKDFPPICGVGTLGITEDGHMKSSSPIGVESVDSEKGLGHDSSSNRMVSGEANGKLKVKSPSSDAFEDETQEINNAVIVPMVSVNELKELGSRELIGEADIKITCEIASSSKWKGDYSEETALNAEISNTNETASNSKLKGEEDWKEITREARNRNVRETALSSKSKVAVSKKNKEEVHAKVSHGSESRSKSEANRKESIEHVQNKASHKEASADKLKRVVAKEFTEKLQKRAAHEIKLRRLDSTSPSTSKKTKREITFSGVKVGKESVKETKDKSFRSNILGESGEESTAGNESQQEESTGLNFPTDRVIVLALSAALYCPLSKGKRAKQILSTTPHSSLGGHKQSPVSKRKEGGSSVWNSGSLEGRVVNKKSPARGGAASQRDKASTAYDKDTFSSGGEKVYKNVSIGQEVSVNVIPFGLPSLNDKSARNEVRQALRLFQTICRKLSQEEEKKPKVPRQIGTRVDTMAYKLLKESNKFVNTGECILGSVPGVEVGDEFYYRAELAIIGLHRNLQGGIDHTKRGGVIVATSIVASGNQDEMDGTDILYYVGQGGNAGGGDMKPEPQKLERGNLALKNSIESQTPVRVIRGFKESRCNISLGARRKATSTFVYDGLYLVEEYERVDGGQGFLVFKFRLRRIPGQRELPVKEVKQSKKLKEREGLCMVDISEGKEKIPIGVVNTIDGEFPPPFHYITKMIYPSWYNPSLPEGCDCTGGCLDSIRCVCAVRNGGEIAFNSDGAIVEAKPLVYECGPSCTCPLSCQNRVSQHGITIPLEIFKTESRGWGVRALSSIPSGTFICEYTGELLTETEAEKRTGNDEYLFDIGQNYNDQMLRDDISSLLSKSQSDALGEVSEDAGFTIDAAQYGNVGRFINHSCSPNLYAQDVLYDHGDKRMPHVMFFAAENIPPLQELTYHYNYIIDHVRDSDGNIKRKDCYCGSHECTGRLY
ncbi:hypothetical protein ACLOJK_033842 [Asimina triloba]